MEDVGSRKRAIPKNGRCRVKKKGHSEEWPWMLLRVEALYL